MPSSPRVNSILRATFDFSHKIVLPAGQADSGGQATIPFAASHDDPDLSQRVWQEKKSISAARALLLDALVQVDVGGSTVRTIDFSGGAGVNAIGIINYSDQELKFTPTPTTGWTAGPFTGGLSTDIPIPPRGLFVWGNGQKSYAVGAGDGFTLTPASGEVNYWMFVAGDDV